MKVTSLFHCQIRQCEEKIDQLLSSLQKESPPCPQLPQIEKEHCTPKRNARKTKANRSPYYFNAPAAIKKVTQADLTTIPGIDANIAMKILSEVGTDMSCWANEKAFASWLGLCPGNKISGRRILISKTKPTDNRAAQALRMAASSL